MLNLRKNHIFFNNKHRLKCSIIFILKIKYKYIKLYPIIYIIIKISYSLNIIFTGYKIFYFVNKMSYLYYYVKLKK